MGRFLVAGNVPPLTVILPDSHLNLSLGIFDRRLGRSPQSVRADVLVAVLLSYSFRSLYRLSSYSLSPNMEDAIEILPVSTANYPSSP
jgi:hypothetical protein